jgi:tetratricopeptide (TPR) repeat protein
MSYTPSVEDTQPRSPLKDAPLKPTIHMDDDHSDEPVASPGCGMMGLITAVLVIFAVLIVVLAGAAGWTAGQREAQALIVNTRQAAIREQVDRIPGDVASGNTVLLRTRLEWLATAAPDYDQLPALEQTGTAVYMGSMATAAPTATPTPEVTEDAPAQMAISTQSATSGYDAASLYTEAETAMERAQWQDAIDLLDVVIGVDPTYQTTQVRYLLNQALQNRALELYNADQPAAGNLMVTRAEEYGQIDSNLDYERYAANLYLEARSAIGLGSPVAISRLQELIGLGAGGRYYDEALNLLYNQYILIGDSYYGQGNYCSAANQYQQAMRVFSSGTANGKYDNAQNLCMNAVPTYDPNWALTPGAVAPVGVVTTPGA